MVLNKIHMNFESTSVSIQYFNDTLNIKSISYRTVSTRNSINVVPLTSFIPRCDISPVASGQSNMTIKVTLFGMQYNKRKTNISNGWLSYKEL